MASVVRSKELQLQNALEQHGIQAGAGADERRAARHGG